MKRALTLFVTTLVLVSAVSAQTPQPNLSNEQRWKTEHEAGLRAIEQGLYSQAVRSFQTAIVEAQKFGPSDLRLAQSISGIAQAYLQQGNLAAAERQFQQVLAVYEKAPEPNNPNAAQVLNGLATVQRLRGNYTEAIALSRRSLTILEKTYGPGHPNVAISQNNLAMILRLHGDYEESRILSAGSVSILEKALGPEHVNVAISLNNLVLAYLPQGNYAAAETPARRALSIFEKAPAAGTSNLLQSLESLAEICRELGKYEESERLYRRVLSVRWSGGADALSVLDKLADLLNVAFLETSLEDAQKAFDQAQGWSGLSVDLYIAMTRALRDRALTAAPESVIRRAIQAFPNALETRYELAQGYAETHRYNAAIDTLEEAAKLKVQASGDPARDRYVRSRIHEEIARMRESLSQFDEALLNFNVALALDPGNAHAFVALGDLFLKLDRPDDAATQYAEAVLLSGGDSAAYYGIAEVNRRLGRYPQAVLAADRALAINPKDTKASYVRSAALLRDGRREEGELELERFRALESNDHDEGVRVRTIPVTLHEAAARLEDGQGDAALEVLREGIRSYPDSASLRLNSGIIQSRLGRHEDAVKTFQAMIDQGIRGQDDFLVHLNLSREYEILGDMKASQLHRLNYLQKYDDFLKNKRR